MAIVYCLSAFKTPFRSIGMLTRRILADYAGAPKVGEKMPLECGEGTGSHGDTGGSGRGCQCVAGFPLSVQVSVDSGSVSSGGAKCPISTDSPGAPVNSRIRVASLGAVAMGCQPFIAVPDR